MMKRRDLISVILFVPLCGLWIWIWNIHGYMGTVDVKKRKEPRDLSPVIESLSHSRVTEGQFQVTFYGPKSFRLQKYPVSKRKSETGIRLNAVSLVLPILSNSHNLRCWRTCITLTTLIHTSYLIPITENK